MLNSRWITHLCITLSFSSSGMASCNAFKLLIACLEDIRYYRRTQKLCVEEETFGYPLMRPDLKIASRILCASNFSSDWLEFAPSALRSFNACSNVRGTPSGRLLALNATAATIYQGFPRTTWILLSEKKTNLCFMINN